MGNPQSITPLYPQISPLLEALGLQTNAPQAILLSIKVKDGLLLLPHPCILEHQFLFLDKIFPFMFSNGVVHDKTESG